MEIWLPTASLQDDNKLLSYLSLTGRVADPLCGIVTLLRGLLDALLAELYKAPLAVVLAADLLCGRGVVRDVGEVALGVHLVDALLHRNFFNTLITE